MPAKSIPKHGMSNLRSMTSPSRGDAAAYKSYLRISFLEMERARRQQVLCGAERTIRRIGDRFREIDAEKQAILSALGGQPAASGPPVAAAGTARSGRRDRSFNLRY